MKTVIALVLILSFASGCATQGMVARGPGSTDPTFQATAPDPFPPAPPQNESMPRLVIPATGGPPVMGISVGGDLYLPVTGGAPIPGMPITP